MDECRLLEGEGVAVSTAIESNKLVCSRHILD